MIGVKTKKEIEDGKVKKAQFYIYWLLIGLFSVTIFFNLKYLFVTDMNTAYVCSTGVHCGYAVATKTAYITRCITVVAEIISLFVLLITKVNIISLIASLLFIFLGFIPLFFDLIK